MALHDTGEALALGGADDVDQLAGREDVDGELLAERVLGRVVGAQLDQVTARRDAGLAKWPASGLVTLRGSICAVGDLDGGVAVDLVGADLGDDVRPGLDDGHRDDLVVLVPDLGHAELLAQQSLWIDLLSHWSTCRPGPTA